MAIQAPPPAVPQAVSPTPPAKKSGCAGCSVGCLGCIGVLVLVLLLAIGGGYFFFIAQAQAGVPSPAALLVANTTVEVGHNDSGYATAQSGQTLDAGTSVRTSHTGHATITFPDGSLTRLAPDTTVTVQAAQLNSDGTLKSATITQRIGRTLNVVQKLAGGASFQVDGHSVSAAVRGTQFEVVVRADQSNQFKVFDGTVQVSGQTSATLTANQQIEVDKNGKLGPQQGIQPDKQDPYAMAAQCAKAVAQGTTPGTVQTTTGGPIATGQSVEVDYSSAGGVVTVMLCYPGSLMSLSVTDPAGTVHTTANTGTPVSGHIAGPPGLWRATVKAVDVAGGEPFAVSFATNLGCNSAKVDTGTVVRETLSNGQLAQSMAQSGVSGVTIQVQGTSSSSARIHYASTLGGFDFSWTIDFYAATPNLGYVFTQVTVRGVNVTTQVVSRLNAAGAAVTSIPQDYTVDRVYSCIGPDGDMMVIEGHR